MKKLSFILLTTFLLASLASAHEEEERRRTSKGYIGWRIGYHELDSDLDEEEGIAGMFGGLYLNSVFSLEASIDQKYGSHVTYTRSDDEYDFDFDFDSDYFSAAVGIKASIIPVGPIRPFVTGGLGYVEAFQYKEISPGVALYEDIEERATYLGCGIDFFKFRNRARGISLTWENRWTFTDGEELGGFTVDNDGFMSTIGIKWNL